ncbi:M48 family metallopeptidase, partial [Acinetobacter pollinis]|uniref:M48 family metallopeptidase n=2 Tax=Acinetobacter pollinis TaxID=2605270 RepID=UPI0018C2D250
ALEEHSKNKIGADALTNLAVNLGKSYAGQSLGQFGSAALDLGSQVGVGLPYSRSLETRADYGGLILMAKAGYNPQAAITLWQKMNKLEGQGGVSFLSTHPSNVQRIEAMQKNLPAAMAIYNQRIQQH